MAHFNVQFCKVSMAHWLKQLRKWLPLTTGELESLAGPEPKAEPLVHWFPLALRTRLPRGPYGALLGRAGGCSVTSREGPFPVHTYSQSQEPSS